MKPKTKPDSKRAKKPRAAPGWLTIAQLSKLADMSRNLVAHHLDKGGQGCPKDDGYRRWEGTVAVPYLKESQVWADSGRGGTSKALRDEKMALEVDALKREAAIEAGQLVLLKQATEVNAGLWVELHSMLRQQLEFVLPPQYQGKTPLECAELNLGALEAIGEAFRSGNQKLEALGNKTSA